MVKKKGDSMKKLIAVICLSFMTLGCAYTAGNAVMDMIVLGIIVAN